MKSCFFIGHRETPPEIYPALEKAVERHITEFGVTDFVVGNYGNFDRLAANRYMVEHVDYLIAYVWHPASNARNLVESARKREAKKVLTITMLEAGA